MHLGIFLMDLFSVLLSVQSYLFVQCWPEIFLVQCLGNLCNVRKAFAATGHYQKLNLSKIKIAQKWCCSDKNALSFFLRNVVWSLLSITQGFYLCNVVPRELWQHWIGYFHMKCCLVPLGQHCIRLFIFGYAMFSQENYDNKEKPQGQHYIGFFSCNAVPEILRQH